MKSYGMSKSCTIAFLLVMADVVSRGRFNKDIWQNSTASLENKGNNV